MTTRDRLLQLSDELREIAETMADEPLKETRKARLIREYGQAVYDDYSKRFDAYVASSGKRYRDKSATIEGWLKKDGVAKKPVSVATASVPECCGAVKTTIDGGVEQAMCTECGKWWTLVDGKWRAE